MEILSMVNKPSFYEIANVHQNSEQNKFFENKFLENFNEDFGAPHNYQTTQQ